MALAMQGEQIMVDQERTARDERVLRALHELRVQAEESLVKQCRAIRGAALDSRGVEPPRGCGVSKELGEIQRHSASSSRKCMRA